MNRLNPKHDATRHVDGSSRSPARSARRVLIVAVPPVRTLDVFGPLEVFGDANRSRSGGPIYEVSVISAGTDRDVLSHLGLPVRTDQTYGEYCGPIDTLLVAGYDGVSKVRYEQNFLKWLNERCANSRRFGSVCTGALVLAEAGLLDGRRATTHWNWCEELARDYPRVTVDPNPIYVRDGNCYTSAGVTAGLDGALALVSLLRGDAAAQEIQLAIEYALNPIFHSGSPESAPAGVLQSVQRKYHSIGSAREAEAIRYAAGSTRSSSR